MRKIAANALRPDMMFSEDVFLDEKTLFVAKNIPISRKDIENLKKWKISDVLTSGYSVSSHNGRTADKYHAEETSQAGSTIPGYGNITIKSAYQILAQDVRSTFERVRTGEDVNAVIIDRVVDSLFSLVQDSIDEVVHIILTSEKPDDSHAENALNTSLIALLIGKSIFLPNHRLVQLTTGALLHDIGMVFLPDSIIKKRSNLEDHEYEKIKEHPGLSNRIITKVLKYPEEIGRIALHHHERWDGEGYPSGLKDEEIDQLSRIVAVADAFEAMVSSRPYRTPMISYFAIKALLSDNSRHFDPAILKVFIKTFGIYPIGSVVLLSDSRVGRVIAINSESPIRPRIQIVTGLTSGPVIADGEIIDLSNEKQLFIVRAINTTEMHRERV